MDSARSANDGSQDVRLAVPPRHLAPRLGWNPARDQVPFRKDVANDFRSQARLVRQSEDLSLGSAVDSELVGVSAGDAEDEFLASHREEPDAVREAAEGLDAIWVLEAGNVR
jgi:hypothetical protein